MKLKKAKVVMKLETKGFGILKMLLKHFRYGESGFTLIELLIAIAILGILAAVIVPIVLD